jgi:hypothetical protein
MLSPKFLKQYIIRNMYRPKGRTITLLNEAINFEKEWIFIAIPKTGTTSVRRQLRQKGRYMINDPHLNINQLRDLIYIFLLRQNLGTNRKFPNANHIDDNEIRNLAEKIFNSFFKFSAVRNPWARAVSIYFRREGVKTKNSISFNEFIENYNYSSDTCLHPTKHKNQIDWLTSNNGKLLVNYVYKVENFSQAIHEISNMTDNKINLKNVSYNMNPHSKSIDYKRMYNDKARKLIQKRFEKDIDYFKYTF